MLIDKKNAKKSTFFVIFTCYKRNLCTSFDSTASD